MYEYLVEAYDVSSDFYKRQYGDHSRMIERLTGELNKMANEGWEVVEIIRDKGDSYWWECVVVFKKEKKQ